MALILNIETTTKVCSVALFKDDRLMAMQEVHEEKFSHAEKLNVFIDQVMEEAGSPLTELDAIAISQGPGSYTGLRIGTSTAKGLAYALGVPLIAVDTLKAMANGLLIQNPDYTGLIQPMIDARRMEVFTNTFSAKGEPLGETQAVVLEQDSFKDLIEDNELTFLGDGAEKARALYQDTSNLRFESIFPSAKYMGPLAFEKHKSSDFVDLAYFEPFYLKDFIAGKPRKLV